MNSIKNTKSLTLTAVLSVILALSGMLKIPSMIGGAEFQLSAPIAICIVACFGFRRYIVVGALASCINLCLGTHTLINVVVAFVFRIVAGGIVSVGKKNWLTLAISGPIGTLIARIVLSKILHVSMWPLIAAASPGMIFTAVTSLILYPVLKQIVQQSGQLSE